MQIPQPLYIKILSIAQTHLSLPPSSPVFQDPISFMALSSAINAQMPNVVSREELDLIKKGLGADLGSNMSLDDTMDYEYTPTSNQQGKGSGARKMSISQ